MQKTMDEKKKEEKEEKKEEEEDMLREKSNDPNLKGAEKIKGIGGFKNGNLRLERQWLQKCWKYKNVKQYKQCMLSQLTKNWKDSGPPTTEDKAPRDFHTCISHNIKIASHCITSQHIALHHITLR